MPEKAKSTVSKSEDDPDNSSEPQTSEPQKESKGTFMPKEETIDALRDIHLQLHFQDTEHMSMLPRMWLRAQKAFPEEDVRNEITDFFCRQFLLVAPFLLRMISKSGIRKFMVLETFFRVFMLLHLHMMQEV